MFNDDKTRGIERLSNIILLLKNTALQGGLNTSDDVIFQCANKLFISENIEQSKNNKRLIQTPKIDIPIPATAKQLNYLDKLKVKYPVNITKKEAINLLREATK